MITIGITGGIGSGKTVISKTLTAMGYPVYIADTASKELTNTHPLIKEKLIDMFGKDIFLNGQLNKKMLADAIFHDTEKLTAVNNIIHPVVMQDFEDWKKQQHSPIVFIESAILFENGLNKFLDKTILITSPLALRIKRIKQRDNVTEEEIKSRINNQMNDETKEKLADYIIINDEKTAILPQINKILEKIISES